MASVEDVVNLAYFIKHQWQQHYTTCSIPIFLQLHNKWARKEANLFVMSFQKRQDDWSWGMFGPHHTSTN